MAQPEGRRARAREALRRLPLSALVVLPLVLAVGPIGLAVSHDRRSAPPPGKTLADVARDAGCRLREYGQDPASNPPVSGRMVERAVVGDGSYIGQDTPSVEATTHALLHGRVLIQYRPGLPRPQVRALDRLVSGDSDRVVGFANQTGMRAPVAATAYLSLLTCPGVSPRTLHALRVFRDRRRGFGNAF